MKGQKLPRLAIPLPTFQCCFCAAHSVISQLCLGTTAICFPSIDTDAQTRQRTSLKGIIRVETGFVSPHLRSIPFWPVILSSVRSRAWESAVHIKTQAQEDIQKYFCCQHWVTENAGTYPSTGLSNHILGNINFKSDTSSPFPESPVSKSTVEDGCCCRVQLRMVCQRRCLTAAKGAGHSVGLICSCHKNVPKPQQLPLRQP